MEKNMNILFNDKEIAEIIGIAEDFVDISTGIGFSFNYEFSVSNEGDALTIVFSSSGNLLNIMAPDYNKSWTYRKNINETWEHMCNSIKSDFFSELKNLFEEYLAHERKVDLVDYKTGDKVYSSKRNCNVVVANPIRTRDAVFCIDLSEESENGFGVKVLSRNEMERGWHNLQSFGTDEQ